MSGRDLPDLNHICVRYISFRCPHMFLDSFRYHQIICSDPAGHLNIWEVRCVLIAARFFRDALLALCQTLPDCCAIGRVEDNLSITLTPDLNWFKFKPHLMFEKIKHVCKSSSDILQISSFSLCLEQVDYFCQKIMLFCLVYSEFTCLLHE